MHRLLLLRHRLDTLVSAAHRCAYAGLLLLGPALAGVSTIVFYAVAGRAAGVTAGAVALVAFAVFWLAVPLLMRRDRPRTTQSQNNIRAAYVFGAAHVQSAPAHGEADQAGGERHDGDRDSCGGETTRAGAQAGQSQGECRHRGDVEEKADGAECFDSGLVGAFHHAGFIPVRGPPQT